jgi:hypothetical protein
MTTAIARKIVALIDEETDHMDIFDTFTTAGAALAEAVEVIDKRYASYAFAEGVVDCIYLHARDEYGDPKEH